eukprot:m.12205 g.12205  ORF g.12205 m.12205 type:complete len:789 (+) comp3213_c0_seq1:30-2396(+)
MATLKPAVVRQRSHSDPTRNSGGEMPWQRDSYLHYEDSEFWEQELGGSSCTDEPGPGDDVFGGSLPSTAWAALRAPDAFVRSAPLGEAPRTRINPLAAADDADARPYVYDHVTNANVEWAGTSGPPPARTPAQPPVVAAAATALYDSDLPAPAKTQTLVNAHHIPAIRRAKLRPPTEPTMPRTRGRGPGRTPAAPAAELRSTAATATASAAPPAKHDNHHHAKTKRSLFKWWARHKRSFSDPDFTTNAELKSSSTAHEPPAPAAAKKRPPAKPSSSGIARLRLPFFKRRQRSMSNPELHMIGRAGGDDDDNDEASQSLEARARARASTEPDSRHGSGRSNLSRQRSMSNPDLRKASISPRPPIPIPRGARAAPLCPGPDAEPWRARPSACGRAAKPYNLLTASSPPLPGMPESSDAPPISLASHPTLRKGFSMTAPRHVQLSDDRPPTPPRPNRPTVDSNESSSDYSQMDPPTAAELAGQIGPSARAPAALPAGVSFGRRRSELTRMNAVIDHHDRDIGFGRAISEPPKQLAVTDDYFLLTRARSREARESNTDTVNPSPYEYPSTDPAALPPPPAAENPYENLEPLPPPPPLDADDSPYEYSAPLPPPPPLHDDEPYEYTTPLSTPIAPQPTLRVPVPDDTPYEYTTPLSTPVAPQPTLQAPATSQADDYENKPWYFGNISRRIAVDLLTLHNSPENGTFLVRKSSQGPDVVVVSVCHEGKVYHNRIVRDDLGFRYSCEPNFRFPTIDALIEHFRVSPSQELFRLRRFREAAASLLRCFVLTSRLMR